MIGYLRLLRPGNAVMGAVAVMVGGFLVLSRLGYPQGLLANLLMAMAAAFLILGAGNAINDYFDIESDRVNRPKRPIPSGQVGKKGALAFSIILFLIGIALSGFINWVCFAMAVINSLILIAYSLELQDRILWGNIAISYLVGSTFLFGGASMGNLTLPFLLMLLAGLSNLSREIVKDLEDIEGDRLKFLKRLTSGIKSRVAERFGFSGGRASIRYDKKITIVAGISLLLAIFISPLPYMMGILGISYLIVLIPTDFFLALAIALMARASGRKHFHRISKIIKLGMLLGLVAFIIGVLV
jgi:geranylgeranylglycerol-phosphate geranylgeranyltransferase